MNNQPPNLVVRILDAVETHAKLRAQSPTSTSLTEKRPLYESLKSLFAELWNQTQQVTDQRIAQSLRSAIHGLTVDAEYFAGVQTDAEGYRDATDVFDQYALLQRYFEAHPTNDAHEQL